jgi:MFS family permease
MVSDDDVSCARCATHDDAMGASSRASARADRRRWALFALAFFSSSLVAGTVYGWPPLRRSLIGAHARSGASDALGEKRLAVHFTAGSWSVQGGRFIAGMSRDHFGTRFTCCACLAFVAAGAAAMAAAKPTDDAMLTFGMFAMGIGSGVQLCVQPVAALFPECASTVMSALSGAFQVSGLVFLALTAGDEREIGFYVFSAVAAALFALCYVMLPRGQSFLEVVPEDASTTSGRRAEAKSARAEGLANGHSREEQLRSAEYLGLVAWFTVVVCPLQFYISAIGYELETKGDTTGEYSSIFSAAYGAVAVFAAVGGRIADKIGQGACQGLATASVAISFAILCLPKSAGLGVQVFGMTAYSFGRLFVFAMYFSNVGRRFGFEHYGTLCGIGLLISAIWSLIQYPLLSWAVEKGSNGANALCCAMCCVTLPYAAWLARREAVERAERRLRRELANENH